MDYTRTAEESQKQEIKSFERYKKDKEDQDRFKRLQKLASGKDWHPTKQEKEERAEREQQELYTLPKEIEKLLKEGKITGDKRIKRERKQPEKGENLMTKQNITYPKLSEGVLTPAYGRDYRNKADLIKDFRAGKDFKIIWQESATYCSIRDGVIDEMVKFRYNRGEKAIFYTITASDFVRG